MELIRMKNLAIFIALFAAFLAAGVEGDSHGAPYASCADMGSRSVHAVALLDPSTSPFGVTVAQKSISKGGSFNITLAAVEGSHTLARRGPVIDGYFTGFLLMAFDPNDKKAEAMGYFTQVDSTKGQFMDCWDRPKSAVTHVNANFKQAVHIVWTAPEDYVGEVVFQATFTANIVTMWARVSSDVVMIVDDSSSTEASSSTTTPTTTTTTPASTTPSSAVSINTSWVVGLTMAASLFFAYSNF